jgi:hypothetical protein
MMGEKIQGLLTGTCGQHREPFAFKHELPDGQLILFVVYTQDEISFAHPGSLDLCQCT